MHVYIKNLQEDKMMNQEMETLEFSFETEEVTELALCAMIHRDKSKAHGH